MMDIKRRGSARTRHGHAVEKHVGNRRLRNGPKDARPLGPAGGGSRDVLERDVFPIGCGAGGGRGGIGGRRQGVGIPTREIEGVIQDACHSEVRVGHIGVGAAPVPPGFPADAVLGSFKCAGIDQKVLHTALGITADGKPVTRTKGAVADGDALDCLGATQLD